MVGVGGCYRPPDDGPWRAETPRRLFLLLLSNHVGFLTFSKQQYLPTGTCSNPIKGNGVLHSTEVRYAAVEWHDRDDFAVWCNYVDGNDECMM